MHDESTAGKKDSDRQQEETIEAAAKGKAKKSLFAKLFKRKDDTAVADEENNSDSDAGKNKKEEKKEKKKKRKEIIKVIDEVEEDEGRINRVGAGIVFVFFGLLAICLLFGTNKITYSLSIQHAADYFERQKYDEAYSEICAVDLKDEDMAIYDKIMTVMYVNKYLNSYNNYYYLGMYPQALDSLLKGMIRYDKYIDYATMIGIKFDMDNVRNQILAELENVFNLSEDEVKKLISINDTDKYSKEVYKIVEENMNK